MIYCLHYSISVLEYITIGVSIFFMEMLEKIKTDTIQSQVYKKIKQLIIDGKWKPGEKIPSESTLSEIFGVGRVSIRSALQYLAAQGYIDTKRGEGSYVKELNLKEHMDFISPILKLTQHDALQIIEFRKIIEPNMMRLVIKNTNESDIKELKEIYDDMVKNKENIDIFAKYDANFHYKLAQMTHNDLIIGMIQIVWDIFLKSMKTNVSIMTNKYAIYYHKKIISSIEKKDVKLAFKTMKKHLNVALNNISKSDVFKEGMK